MIDLRSADPSAEADRVDARRDGAGGGWRRRVRRGLDGPRAGGGGWPELFGHEAALFTPPGRWPMCWRSGPSCSPARRCSASPAPTSRGPSWGVRGVLRHHHAHLDPLAAARSTCSCWCHDSSPSTGAVLVPTAVISVENTHNFAVGSGAAADRPRYCASSPRPQGCRGARGRRPDLERPRRHRHPAGGVRRSRTCWPSACRVGLGALVGSLMVGLADAVAMPRAQMGGRARSRRRRAARARPPRGRWPSTTTMLGCSPPPAVATRRRSTNIASWSSGPTRRRTSCGRGTRASLVSRSVPGPIRLVTHLDVSRADAERCGRDPCGTLNVLPGRCRSGRSLVRLTGREGPRRDPDPRRTS